MKKAGIIALITLAFFIIYFLQANFLLGLIYLA